MTDWQTDGEQTRGPATSISKRRAASRRTSQDSAKSRRSVTPPRKGASSPSMATDRGDKASKRSSRDVTTDPNISILDPRRFTPTLHANLVSEILTLRRDQEDKIKLIESLESALHATKQDHETAQEDLTNTSKESRSLKRQLSLLEGGTSSALGELARERDEAVESVADARKRLEVAQKKIRNQEDDSQRVHESWAQEKDNWEDERRKYERKIHVAESRLKVVLDEVAAYQATHMSGVHQGMPSGLDSEVEESGKDNDGASVRTMSMTNSIRFSLANGQGSIQLNGNSLADELNFEGDDDDQTDVDGRGSVLSSPTSPKHARTFSRDSIQSRAHRRNLSLESLKRPGSAARGKLFMNQTVLEALEGEEEEMLPPPPKVTYTDTGIQFSPPPSPKMQPAIPATPEPAISRERLSEVGSPARGDNEIEANQRRKRVHINKPLIIEPMISAASQTTDEPLSPPKTPKSPYGSMETSLEPESEPMISTSTQTDELEVPRAPTLARLTPSPPPVPSINIQPPTSRPTTPRSPRLPQYFKHFGCQVNLASFSDNNDVGVQTEGIQTDRRMALLPAHLQPSAISSRPTSPNVSVPHDMDKNFTPVPGNLPPRNPRRLAGSRGGIEIPSSPPMAGHDELYDKYAHDNDDGPLSNQRGQSIRRPQRFSSLFAGFETASSDEADEFGDGDVSDSEYRTALSAPRPQSISSRQAKRTSIGTVGTVGTSGTVPTSPEQSTPKRVSHSSAKATGTEVYSSFSLADRDSTDKKYSRKMSRSYGKNSVPSVPSLPEVPQTQQMAGPSDRGNIMRKAAMIQNGIVNYNGRSRSPSLPETKNPPYPIPTRASSRKTSMSTSAPSDGTRSPTPGDGWQRRGGRTQYPTPSLRKVRSAAALPRNQRHRRHGSRSPPPLSPSTEAPGSPALPPMPRNDITTPRNRDRGSSHYRRHRHELSTNTDNTNMTEPVSQASGSQTTGVVDAIAQTMVGEWMFKYVRRRKSFGVTDNNAKDENSNERHKRWVWLAPYEHAILWSSKQPSSGSALMGKTGRKLTIQSVLDVKDDNPTGKFMSPIFNRSILILTPQRALKFTAVSAERHYLWLTALSFLAHSSQAVPENIAAPQPQVKQQPMPNFELPRAKPKRVGIRDSIRLAKGKSNAKLGPPSIPSLPSVPSSRMGDVASFRVPDSAGAVSSNHSREDSRDAADPPSISRFHDRNGPAMVHGRKRSNTGGHVPPPLSFRGFSGPVTGGGQHNSTNSTTNASVGTAGSSDVYTSHGPSSNTTWGMSQTASQRTSEASSRPGNFFDAIGTMRMEAFISPLALSQGNNFPDESEELRHTARRRSKEIRRRRSRSRQRDSYSSRGRRGMDDYYGGSKTAGEEDYFRDDPFKGF